MSLILSPYFKLWVLTVLSSFYSYFSISFNFNLPSASQKKKPFLFNWFNSLSAWIHDRLMMLTKKAEKVGYCFSSCSDTLQWNNKKESHTKKYLLDFITIDLCTLRLILKEEKRRWTVRKWNEMLHTQKSYVC